PPPQALATGQGQSSPEGGGPPAPPPDQAAEERETERALEDGAAGPRTGAAAGEEQASPSPAAASADDDRKRRASRIHVLCGELWGTLGQEAVDRRRHFLVGVATDGRETSSARLTDDEQQRMINTLVMIREGHGEV